ncbi:hypothetical protein HYC85_017376 [Camellia sinensis]|uniref:Piwi domain-containing protein n=1 Tax=Camellia sinensis TaxID=4442 RepID=A0A7J7H617_CAMSI|nr:hypothetical protein HYC85_017376 [Camellia sinensis]
MTRNGGRNYNGGNHSGRGGNGGGGGRGRGQGSGGRGGARDRGPPQQGQNQGGGGAYRPPAPLQQVQGIGVGLTSGEWGGQPWSASSVAGQSTSQPVSRKLPEQALAGGEDTVPRSYRFTIELVNELKVSKLNDYSQGMLSNAPREVFQAMDSVMKDNPSRHMFPVGRSFYSKEFRPNDDLGYGIAASRGFQQSLKATAQGPALCLDSSVLPFRKQLPVLDFLTEQGFQLKDVSTSRREVMREVMHVLKGLKVHVTHRLTNQKYTIAGFSDQNTRDITFTLEDREGENPPREISLGEYFRERYNREPRHQDMPCVDLGKGDFNPLFFRFLFWLSCRDVSQNFEIEVEKNMTRVLGRVIEPPDLKLGTPNGNVNVLRINDRDKCQWNLLGKAVVGGKPLEHWALIDFSSYDGYRLNPGHFVQNLRNRCRNLGIRVEEPAVRRFTNMNEFSCIAAIQKLLHNVVEEASQKYKGQLQLIVCVMSARHDGCKYLKWVSETQIGVLTQCCLVGNANKGNDQHLANLALKINGKIGGSNVELNGPLPGFEGDEHVMFVGADVNHPKGEDCRSCPSIAAVVASVNWPAANRYVARFCPQEHRKEKIVDFGAMFLDLVNTYAKLNKVKPKKIVVFRDGVSEGQFDMVLNEELLDLKNAIYEGNYRPTITLTVAQKRHPTRLFLENERDGGASGNVPPGTIVDTTIVHPFQFDFYLCSHYGNLGTSKPTHYYCLFDENKFTSDKLQKLIYDLCYTFARCTKPVSLVPPVYYADLVAYRGRLYQEVVMEFQPPPSVSSSSSSPSSAASLNERFYALHPDVKDTMFFI